jgi:ubiquinone/menaquinone biosynthesis C-methylase UbiE
MENNIMNYDKQAPIYDRTRRARSSIIDFLLTEINSNDYKIILDFGCGTGNYIYGMRNRNNELSLIGMDPSAPMREIAHHKNPMNSILNGNHDFIPLENNCLDMIFMVNVLHHVSDIEKMFDEFKRVIKKGGCIYIITESHKQINEKSWLKYFEGARELMLDIFHDIPFIIEKAQSSEFSLCSEIQIDENPKAFDTMNFIYLVQQKAFSMLHLINDNSYDKGLIKLEEESSKNDFILRHLAKTILCFKK